MWQVDDSSESDDLYESSEELDKETTQDKGTGQKHLSFFDSESEEEERRYVRTEKEKRFDELNKAVKKINNSIKINDWTKIPDEWSAIVTACTKAKHVIEQHGPPKFFLSCLVALDDLITRESVNKTLKQKPKVSRLFNTVKSKEKKWIKENPHIEKAMKEYKENPVGSDEDVEQKATEPSKSKSETTETGTFDDFAKSEDSDDEMWDQSLESTDDDEDGDFREKDLSYWYTPDEAKPTRRGGGKIDKGGRGPNKDTTVTVTPAPPTQKEPTEVEAKKPEEPKKQEEWTPEKIDKKVRELLKERGTKSYNPREHVKIYKVLLPKVDELGKKITMRFHLINSLYDCNPNLVSHLPVPMWKMVYNELVTILDTLFQNTQVKFFESTEELLAATQTDDITKLPPNVCYGHLLFSIDRLHDEFIRSLQIIDPHSQDYINRLGHERNILLLLQYAEKYYQNQKDLKRVSEIAFRELEYLYYKRSSVGGGIEEIKVIMKDDADPENEELETEEPALEEEQGLDENSVPIVEEKLEEIEFLVPKDIIPYTDLKETVLRLSNLVYQFSTDDRQKRKAMLQQIYHLALHDMFYEARDLMLMTHFQEKIHKAKIATQVMFNRVMVQLGLAAFRKGRIEDAHNCIHDIVVNGKSKELLAQGINNRNYQTEKSNEQERLEKRRQIPYHMHINIELVECVHLVSALLLEIPNMAQARLRDFKRKQIISKHFRRVLDLHERQVFSGPPENTRESVLVAAKALQQGDWHRTRDLIINLDIWKLMHGYETTLNMVARQIQEQGLKTYLFTFGQYYESVSVSHLASIFELEENAVHAIISKMIINDELCGSLDQTTNCIIISGQDPNQLQQQAMTFAEKLAVLGDTSEVVDSRSYDKRWGQGAAISTSTAGTGEQRQQKNPYAKKFGVSPRSQYTARDRNTNRNKTTRTTVTTRPR